MARGRDCGDKTVLTHLPSPGRRAAADVCDLQIADPTYTKNEYTVRLPSPAAPLLRVGGLQIADPN